MTVRFVPLDAMQEFKPGRLDQIVGWLEEAALDIVPALQADRVDIVVVPSKWLIPGWNVNGFAHGSGRITMGVDPDSEGRERLPLAQQLRAMLAHELHHAIRARAETRRSLGDSLVAEGLAQCFEEEVGCPTPNYALAVRGELLGLAALRARKDWDATEYDHPRWFFGDKQDPTWPWSGGYSLGYVLVRRFLDEAGLTASAAVAVPSAKLFRETPDVFDELIAAIPAEELV
jgi:hypothetical protein